MRRPLGGSWRSLAALFALAGCTISHDASWCGDASVGEASIDSAAIDASVIDPGPSRLVCPGSEHIVGSRSSRFAPWLSAFSLPAGATTLSEHVAPAALPTDPMGERYEGLVDPESGDLFLRSPLHMARVDAQGGIVWLVDAGASPFFLGGTQMLDLATHEVLAPIDDGVRIFDMGTGAHRDVRASASIPPLWLTPDRRAIGVTATAPFELVVFDREGNTQRGALPSRVDGIELLGADCERAYVLGWDHDTYPGDLFWVFGVRLDDARVEWRVALEHVHGVEDALVLPDRIALVISRADVPAFEHGFVSSAGSATPFVRLSVDATDSSILDLVATPEGGDAVVSPLVVHAFSTNGASRTSSDRWDGALVVTSDDRVVSLERVWETSHIGAQLGVTSLVSLLRAPPVQLDVAVAPDCDPDYWVLLPSAAGAYLLDCNGAVHMLSAAP